MQVSILQKNVGKHAKSPRYSITERLHVIWFVEYFQIPKRKVTNYFGIARSIKGKGITGSGIMIGTPDYMSPEQVEGKDVDQRSDIYSLGIILYEMVTGMVPFEGDTAFTIGVKHKSEIPTNPKEYNQQIPDELSDLILRCSSSANLAPTSSGWRNRKA